MNDKLKNLNARLELAGFEFFSGEWINNNGPATVYISIYDRNGRYEVSIRNICRLNNKRSKVDASMPDEDSLTRFVMSNMRPLLM